MTWRFLPYDFQIRSQTIARYGQKAIPEDMPLQDWGVTYEELEPSFDKFEYLAGIWARLATLKGRNSRVVIRSRANVRGPIRIPR